MKNIDSNFFAKKGYVLIKQFLTQHELKEISRETEQIINKSRKGDWPFVRVYNDYPYFSGNMNIFGTDFPLNNKLNKNIYFLINNLKISIFIKKLTKWNGFKTPLVRLHSFNKFYNYQGMWHRDHESYPSPLSIQSVLYLKKESALRIVPKDKNMLLDEVGLSSSKQTNGLNEQYMNLKKNLYETINADAGDLLFFESALLHQGSCKAERAHFIFRHDKHDNIRTDNDNILNLDEMFLSNFLLDEIKEKGKVYKKKMSLKFRLKRLRSFILYFFPRFKSIYRNFFVNKKKKESIFHSTIFQ